MFREVRPGLLELSDHEIMGITKSIAMCIFFCFFWLSQPKDSSRCRREQIQNSLLGGDENAGQVNPSPASRGDMADVSAASRGRVAGASTIRAWKMYAQAHPDGDSEQPPADTNVSHLPLGAQKKAQKKVQWNDHQTQERDAIHALQSRLSSAAITDISMDPFEVTTVRGTVFAWRTIYRQMVSHDMVVMNWPEGVQLFFGDLLKTISGAMVMIGHDYSLVPPAGSADSAAVKKFW
jgi:hypothetical protein